MVVPYGTCAPQTPIVSDVAPRAVTFCVRLNSAWPVNLTSSETPNEPLANDDSRSSGIDANWYHAFSLRWPLGCSTRARGGRFHVPVGNFCVPGTLRFA